MIQASGLTKKFDQKGIAGLHNLSLSVGEGNIFAIMGPNGSGKTTLLKILSGALKPDSGTVKVDGPVSLFPSTEETPSINVLKFLIKSVTLDIDEEKKVQLARDLADIFEFTFQLRQNTAELSSGQKQKVLLAKEIINKPSLLLLDEPFTHLDPFTRKDILEALFKFIKNTGMTVVWVTHDLEEAFRFSDIIGLMNFGRFEQMETPVKIIRRPRNLFAAQFIGYRNFFPVNLSDGKWLTPWGPYDYEGLEKNEALLVVPDSAWNVSSIEGTAMNVIKIIPSRQAVDYILEDGQKKIFLRASPLRDYPLSSRISVSPRFEECFLIPL